MRNISFALTTAQFLDGSKTVTRRLGWKNLVPGMRLMAVKKAMGLKKGEKIEHLGALEVICVSREPLGSFGDYGREECAREGFPLLRPDEFVSMFAHHMGCELETIVTRIEFRRVTT